MNNFDKFLAENNTENKLVKNASINELTCIIIRNIHRAHDETRKKIITLAKFQKKVSDNDLDDNRPKALKAMHDYLVEIKKYYEGISFDIENIERTLAVWDNVRSGLNADNFEKTKSNLNILEETVRSILNREPNTNIDYWIEFLANRETESRNIN